MATLELNVNAAKGIAETKQLRAELNKLKGSAANADRALDDVGRSADVAGARMQKFAGIAKVGFAAVAAAAVAFAAKGVSAYKAQNAALSEVSTLIEGTADEMKQLDDASRSLAAAYGGSATDQVSAFYQAISAGVGGVTDATKFLDDANKLAIGGVTDITTAVDILSTAVNIYGAEGLTAVQASDQLFVAVKAGKTTVSELGASLGKVLPLAQKLGVGFDEVTSSVAALTKGGISTTEAVTGVKAILAQILKPTEEAKDLARDLKLEFNATGLAGKTLAEFLDEVTVATGGSSEKMAVLFSGIEALVPALALTSSASVTFKETLKEMQTAAGATQVAFDKVSGELNQRFNMALAQIAVEALKVGQALFSVIVPAAEAVADAFQFAADNGDIIASVLVGLAVTTLPAAAVAVYGFATSLGAATLATGVLTTALAILKGAVSFLGGPIGIAIGLLAGAATYLYLFRDGANAAGQGSYDAAAGQVAMNAELDVFWQVGGPAALGAALKLAKGNVVLAKSNFAVANSELAKMAAVNATLEARANDPAIQDYPYELNQRQQTLAVSNTAIAKAQKTLRDLNFAVLGAAGGVIRTQDMIDTAPTPNDTVKPTISPRPLPGDPPTTPGSRRSAEDIEDIASAYDGLRASLDPVIAATQEYDESMKILNEKFPIASERGQEYADTQTLIAAKLRDAKIAANELANQFAGVATSIITGASSAKDAVASLLETLAQTALNKGFAQLFSLAMGSFGGSAPLTSPRPMARPIGLNARGTNAWSGGPTVVGEEGPEIVNLPTGTKIHSATKSRSMSGGESGVVVNIDARGAVEGVAEQIRKEMGRMIPIIRAESYTTIKDAGRRGY